MKKLRHKLKRNKLTKASVKEALDNLPSGIVFFDCNGLVRLCNHTMYRLVHEMTGKDLQSLFELREALQDLPKNTSVIKDKEHYILQDNTVWRFEETPIVDEYGKHYIQCVASNVTDLYNASKRLSQRNKELAEQAEQLKRISDNTSAIAREENNLSMKMKIHDEVGRTALNLRKFIIAGCPEDKKSDLMNNLRNTVSLLMGEIGKTNENDVYTELFEEVGNNVGVKVEVTGELPHEALSVRLISSAIRECMTNAIRHADANKLFIEVMESETQYIIVITNNGIVPQGEIIEGGGLSSVRKRIEKSGGEMALQSQPNFALTVKIPKILQEGELFYEECNHCR